MRKFTEFTAKNLLRRPLVLGVSLYGLMALVFLVLVLKLLGGESKLVDIISVSVSVIGYLILRLVSRFGRPGWEEGFLFRLEKTLKPKKGLPSMGPEWRESVIEVKSPDTLDEIELINLKEHLCEKISKLKPKENLVFKLSLNGEGATLFELDKYSENSNYIDLKREYSFSNIYSLIDLPVNTDPLFSFGMISKIKGEAQIMVRVQGLDFKEIKKSIEGSRKRNSGGTDKLSNIDSEITFQESTRVLTELSRGSEAVVKISLIICCIDKQVDLDESLFCEEKNQKLALLSILALRSRFHRAHFVRAITASDLIPNICDPRELGSAILKSIRSLPLYFSPTDSRLEALHWLVVGASGSGKSFFTGLVLKRLIEQGEKISVIFIDHNRSFRRVVKSGNGVYLEPEVAIELERDFYKLFERLQIPGTICGVELSDLASGEKKSSTHFLLMAVESFLRSRESLHPVYVVLDECWNFLRDEPVLVQRAFREFRKLNGAVVAISQSLSDFVTTETGQSIFQNAPIRILLRQGEDLTPFRAAFGLNDTELNRLRHLRQRKGEYSECLIKTPYLSKLGRLYPSDEEHALLRTDNLRAELVGLTRKKGVKSEVSTSYLTSNC